MSDDPGVVAMDRGRGARCRRGHRGCARDLRHRMGDRVSRARLAGSGDALLPRPGLRAVVLSGGERIAAGRGDLPLRLPRGDRRAVARRAARARIPDARRPLRLRTRPHLRARPVDRPRAAHGHQLLLAPRYASAGVRACGAGARPVRQASPGGRHPLVRPRGQAPALPGDQPRTADAGAAQCALQPFDCRTRPVGDQCLARAPRDARSGMHPGGQRRRAQSHRVGQRSRRLCPGDTVRTRGGPVRSRRASARRPARCRPSRPPPACRTPRGTTRAQRSCGSSRASSRGSTPARPRSDLVLGFAKASDASRRSLGDRRRYV